MVSQIDNQDTGIERVSYRNQYRFWLDTYREDEYYLVEYVKELKKKRTFAKTIRDALNLIRDLRAGNLTWLMFLFPWVWDTIYAKAEADILQRMTPPEPAPSDNISQQIDRLEAAIIAIGSIRVPDGQKPSQTPIPKALPVPSTSPDLDDVDIEVSKAEVDRSTNNPTFNMMISMAAMAGDFTKLSPDALEYGVRIGKVPASYLPQKAAPKAAPKAKDSGTGKPKKLHVPELAEPSFDDLDVDF